ncbi:MAG TPA: YbjN domain-containing protein [Devosia sp.]|nr:YbjN domain-containing protein [Devosia sp.]
MKLATLLMAAALPLLAAGPALAAGNTSSDAAAGAAADSNSNSNSNVSGGDIVTARDPNSIVTALSNAGYPGKLEKMDSGRSSISVQISGLKTYIDFYDCADDLTDCYTLLFNVSLDLKDGTTLAKANDWNSDQITGRVWLDKNNDPTLDFAVSTFDGFTPAVFEQNLKLWDKKIGDFKDFFDF